MDKAQKQRDSAPDNREALRAFAIAEARYKEKENLTTKAGKDLLDLDRTVEDIKEQIKSEKLRQLNASSGGPSAAETEEMKLKARAQAERDAQAREQQQRLLLEEDARRTNQAKLVREENARAFDSGMDAFK
jgi:hypothetical protein